MKNQIQKAVENAYTIYEHIALYTEKHTCSMAEMMIVSELIRRSIRKDCWINGDPFEELEKFSKEICDKKFQIEEKGN